MDGWRIIYSVLKVLIRTLTASSLGLNCSQIQIAVLLPHMTVCVGNVVKNEKGMDNVTT